MDDYSRISNFNRQTREEMDDLTMFSVCPAEVWTLIIENMDDPVDKWHCLIASPFFKKYLPKTMSLFPLVLKVLIQERFAIEEDIHTVLGCRLVCTAWKNAVDNVLEQQAKHPKFKGAHLAMNARGELPTTFFRIGSYTLVELQNEILPSLSSDRYQKSNPFPTRVVNISKFDIVKFIQRDRRGGRARIEITEAYATYYALVESILEKVGHHVWYARFEIETIPFRDWSTRLGTLVQLMPHLKHLYLDKSLLRLDRQPPTLLPLDNLEVFSFENTESTDFEACLTAYKNIKCLVLPDRKSTFGSSGEFDLRSLSIVQNLDTLSLSVMYHQDLRNLPSNWTLRVIRISLSKYACETCNTTLQLTNVLEKLETYKETLEEVFIYMSRSQHDFHEEEREEWESTKCHLRLPKVKKMVISLNGYYCLDFLLGLKSVEILEIDFQRYSLLLPFLWRGEKAVLNFGEALTNNSFEECNIWQLLPSLRRVTLSNDKELDTLYSIPKDTRKYHRELGRPARECGLSCRCP